MFGSVEQINDGVIKVLMDDHTSHEYLVEKHPHLKVGDVVLVNDDGIIFDKYETARRKKRIYELQRRLFRKDD